MMDVECPSDEAEKVTLNILYEGKLKVRDVQSGKMAKLLWFTSYLVFFNSLFRSPNPMVGNTLV